MTQTKTHTKNFPALKKNGYLRNEIIREHSKKQTVKLAKWVSEDQNRFSKLMDIFLNEEFRIVQRASWIVKYVAADHSDWIQPWIRKMLGYCRKPVHDAVKRNVMRILQDAEIPKHLYGLTADVCFNFLSSQKEPVAIKAFSMTVLYNIVQHEPDLRNELILLIEGQLEWEKSAFRSRGRKILKQLGRI